MRQGAGRHSTHALGGHNASESGKTALWLRLRRQPRPPGRAAAVLQMSGLRGKGAASAGHPLPGDDLPQMRRHPGAGGRPRTGPPALTPAAASAGSMKYHTRRCWEGTRGRDLLPSQASASSPTPYGGWGGESEGRRGACGPPASPQILFVTKSGRPQAGSHQSRTAASTSATLMAFRQRLSGQRRLRQGSWLHTLGW